MATNTVQRPLKGSRLSSFYPIKTLPSLSSLDSAFQLQEYISLLIRLDVHDVEKIISIPEKTGTHHDIAFQPDESKPEDKEVEKDNKGDVTVDEACWIYEQLRRLAQDLSHPLITMLQQECTRQSCPEMKAGEWLYLCVAHGNEGAMEQCCAIDYIIHTLDSATALLNSPRAFPSRLSIPASSYRHFSSLARRLGRIFAHAYFHHREAFEQAEAESSLYARFLTLTSKFELVPSEFLVIPPRLGDMDEGSGRNEEVEPPRLLAAAVDPQRDRERKNTFKISGEFIKSLGYKAEDFMIDVERHAHPDGDKSRGDSPSSPSVSDISRKFGRSRTDTMIFSEAVNIVEDISRLDNSESSAESLSKTVEQDIISIDSPIEITPSTSVESEQGEDKYEEQPGTVPSLDITATENTITPDTSASSDLESSSEEEPSSASTVTEDVTQVPLQPAEDLEREEPAVDDSLEVPPSTESDPPPSESSAGAGDDALYVEVDESVEVSEPSVPETQVTESADTSTEDLLGEAEDTSVATSIVPTDVGEDQQLSHGLAADVAVEPVIPCGDSEDSEVVPEQTPSSADDSSSSSAEEIDEKAAAADSEPTEENVVP